MTMSSPIGAKHTSSSKNRGAHLAPSTPIKSQRSGSVSSSSANNALASPSTPGQRPKQTAAGMSREEALKRKDAAFDTRIRHADTYKAAPKERKADGQAAFDL